MEKLKKAKNSIGGIFILNLDDKRAIEAEITKKFLEDNKELVKLLVTNFSNKMKRILLNEKYNFYLKGGNALSKLKGEECTGDYDFQLMPPVATYRNWSGSFKNIDDTLIEILKETIEESAKQSEPKFETECFKANIVQKLAKKKSINLINLIQGDRCDNFMQIGKIYGVKSYSQILRDPNLNEKISKKKFREVVDVKTENLVGKSKDFGPSVYVNYTIPGFILYRLVYRYAYTEGLKNEEISLKSEIIDISIPRFESPEVFMSQEGIITYFRNADDMQFKIPGWGYHFYENINLLQEIKLGVSGSKDKIEKRVNRLKEALEKLKEVNGNQFTNILVNRINEDSSNRKILGYFGAMTYNVDNYDHTYEEEAIALLKTLIEGNINAYFSNFFNEKKDEEYKKLVGFRLNKDLDTTVRIASEAKSSIKKFIEIYNKCAGKENLKLMEEGTNFQFISPLMSGEEWIFAFDYIVVEVKSASLLTKFIEKVKCGGYKCYSSKGTYIFNITENGNQHTKKTSYIRSYKVFFQLCEKLEKNKNINKVNNNGVGKIIEGFLYRSILESQRYALAKMFEKK